jgi:hypothetical protein
VLNIGSLGGVMRAVEFEAEVKNNLIEIPQEYKKFVSKHVKVIVMLEDVSPKYDFSDIEGKLEWTGDDVKVQRELRDEW